MRYAGKIYVRLVFFLVGRKMGERSTAVGGRGKKTYWPKFSCLLSDGSGDGRALHFSLGVDDLVFVLAFFLLHVQPLSRAPIPSLMSPLVSPISHPYPSPALNLQSRAYNEIRTHHTSIILKIQEHPISTSPRL